MRNNNCHVTAARSTFRGHALSTLLGMDFSVSDLIPPPTTQGWGFSWLELRPEKFNIEFVIKERVNWTSRHAPLNCYLISYTF